MINWNIPAERTQTHENFYNQNIILDVLLEGPSRQMYRSCSPETCVTTHQENSHAASSQLHVPCRGSLCVLMVPDSARFMTTCDLIRAKSNQSELIRGAFLLTHSVPDNI